MKNYNVDEEFIKEAHKAACTDWKAKIKDRFPDVFKSLPFEFGREITINTDSNNQEKFPLFIGQNWAPNGLEYKCLLFDESRWKMETIKSNGIHGGYTAISFTKK
jgi:hypothetical protein